MLFLNVMGLETVRKASVGQGLYWESVMFPCFFFYVIYMISFFYSV